MKIFSKNTWGVDVNNAWPLTCKASCLKKIELRPLISGFDFALLEVRNLCVASRLYIILPQHLNFHYFFLFMTKIHTTVIRSCGLYFALQVAPVSYY